MSDIKHTPGPWHTPGKHRNGYRPCPHCGESIIRAASKGALVQSEKYCAAIAIVGCIDNPTKRDKANARLIAASPELLAACEGFVTLDVCVRKGGRGEWHNPETEQTHAIPAELGRYLCALLNLAEAAIAKAQEAQK